MEKKEIIKQNKSAKKKRKKIQQKNLKIQTIKTKDQNKIYQVEKT